jgi:hypothetical protein
MIFAAHRIRRFAPWHGLLLGAFIVLLVPTSRAAEAVRPDLLGVVQDPSGQPLTAVSIFIDSAWVKKGYSPLCPSCYADCAKKALTDYEGHFVIASLDPQLRFSVLVAADGFKPRMVERIDPLHSGLTVVLERLDRDKLDKDKVITGLVRDEKGAPISGAVITPSMFKTSGWDGFSPGIFDPLALTNDEGRFVITAKQSIVHASFTVSARGYASQHLENATPAEQDRSTILDRGVTVTGRLLHEGKPVPGTEAGLVQANRSGAFYGELKVNTDDQGAFTFYNVHGGEDCFVYGIMHTLRSVGAVPALRVKPLAAGTTLDVGTLQVVLGHVLKGRVILSDGHPIPPHTMMLLGRNDAWDTDQVELSPQGEFAFSGLPSESVDLCARIYGYQLSEQNKSLDRLNADKLIGRVDGDITDLSILMDKVETAPHSGRRWSFEEINKSGWSQIEVKQQRLEGVLPTAH